MEKQGVEITIDGGDFLTLMDAADQNVREKFLGNPIDGPLQIEDIRSTIAEHEEAILNLKSEWERIERRMRMYDTLRKMRAAYNAADHGTNVVVNIEK